MLLDKQLRDDIVLVVPNNIRNNILKYLNELDSIYNLKIISKEELINTLTFTYNEKAIYYLMKQYGYKYDIALMYLDNLKYVENITYNNFKLDKLVCLKQELDRNNLLIYDELFKKYLSNHNIVIYGYDYLFSFEKDLLKTYDYEFLEKEKKDYRHYIYAFNHIDDEIEYVANKISSLVNQGVSLNNIKIANINDEYYINIKRIFDLYNIPLEDINTSSIYSTAIIQNFLTELDINKLNIDLENEKNLYIYSKLIEVLNKYTFVNNLFDIKDILIEEFKKIKNKVTKYQNEVEIINITDNIIADDTYVFYLNFNQGYAPIVYKDEEYLSSNERLMINLEDKDELNKILKNNLKNNLKAIKNLTITYKLKSLLGSFEPSTLIDELEYEVINNPQIDNIYSHKMNKLKLAEMLDSLIKYKKESNDLSILFSNYPDIPYIAYDNRFKGILKDDFYKYLNNKISLSYSSLDNYYKCSFRFYVDNVLKINKYEDRFVTKIGNIFHAVLQQAFNSDFNFDRTFSEVVKEYDFNDKEKFFLKKIVNDLKFIIETINYQNTFSSFDKGLYEERVFVNKDKNIKLTFTGVIDKLLYKEVNGANYVVIIDYKTGNPNVSLNNCYYGLNMQLPIYVYLANNLRDIKNVKIVGFYLQKIIHTKPNRQEGKDLLDLKQEELKLDGYTNSNLDYVSVLDKNYNDSKIIKGFRLLKNGNIDSRVKTLSDLEINNLVKLTNDKIDDAFRRILNAEFTINPKQIENENIGCKYCKYKDLCFMKEDNIVYLDKLNYQDFLKEGD